MNYQTLQLSKAMYKGEGGFSAQLERLDPANLYSGTDLGSLDAYQRQLKRFDIKVSGAGSHPLEKFFQTGDAPTLFPEYVSRSVAQGAQEAGILEEIIASKTDINALDYRSITTELTEKEFSDTVTEGGLIPEISILLNDQLVKLHKRGRIFSASYEAIRHQRLDVIGVTLKQIGATIAKAQLTDAVKVLLTGQKGSDPADTITTGDDVLAYGDLLRLWSLFDDFQMNVLLASPDMVLEMLGIPQLQDPATGLNFQATGALTTPLGARLIKSTAVPAGKIIALDRRFALEMVTAGGITVEYDKLIDTQLERAAITCTSGFSKIFPDAVKVLEKAA